MPHSLPLITTMAIALGLALVLGFIAIKLKLPPIVGYLLAGIFIGPFSPGFVANTQIASELAEIGVMLLMFGVGLHFSFKQLLETRKIALPGALIQIAVATIFGALLAISWGWNLGGSLIFGLALSVASTVVLLRALELQGILNSINGQIAIGWLIVEDLAMVFVIVLLPALAGWLGGSILVHEDRNIWVSLGLILLKASAFVAFMLFLGRRFFPKLLLQIARTGSRELFTLCVIAGAISIAFAASRFFGISFALGAFLAGIIMRESEFSARAARESLPFRDAFAVLFFVSVGMLFDPHIFIEHPLKILAVLSIIVIGKFIVAFALVLAFRYPLNTALTVSGSLAQIGEFSFILAGLGVNLKLLPVEGQKLILGGALLSIVLNPLVFRIIEPLQGWIRSKSTLANALERPIDPLVELPMAIHEKYLSGQVVLVGYGRVGRRIGKILLENHIPFVVIEQNRELVERLRRREIAAVFGNASESPVLITAHISRASMLVIAIRDTFYVSHIIKTARQLNSKIETAIRTNNEEEAILLEQDVPGNFFFDVEELAKGMCRCILKRFGMTLP